MRLKHPISRADYTRNDDGTVTITGRSSGRGLFDRFGRWIEGDIRTADPLLCMFVSDGYSTNRNAGNAILEATIKSEEAHP